MTITRKTADLYPSGATELAGFRNKIINGDMAVSQRGGSISSTSSTKLLADGWYHNASGATYSATRQSFTLGQTDVPGTPRYFLRHTVTTGADYCGVLQKIEGVRTVNGKKVTVTAYVKGTNPGGGVIYCYLYQSFGSGGSPSSPVGIDETGNPITLTSSWQKVVFTFDVPSIAGKTVGTDGNDAIWLAFSQGADTSTDAWELDLAHVSLVEGDATNEDDPFSPRHYQQELALCQRYLFVSYVSILAGDYTEFMLPVTMRVAPSHTNLGASWLVENSQPNFIRYNRNSGDYSSTVVISAEL